MNESLLETRAQHKRQFLFCSIIDFVLFTIFFILALVLQPLECGGSYGDCYNNGTCVIELNACNCNKAFAAYWKCLPTGTNLRFNWYGWAAFLIALAWFIYAIETYGSSIRLDRHDEILVKHDEDIKEALNKKV